MNFSSWVIQEDTNFIAINKPTGLLSIPGREGKEISLKKILQEKSGQVFTVHRLDKETSGLIVFAKNEMAHKFLSTQFELRQTEKIYLALVTGSPSSENGTIDAPITEHPVKKGTMVIQSKGKEAVTDYEVLETFGIYSWVQFRIHTGRTHQVRVHAKHLGHPVVCDPLYGDGKSLLLSSFHHKFKLSKIEETEKPLLNRLALHAFRLSFTNTNAMAVNLEAPLPKDLKATLQQLRKWKK
jgi:23S rRNA pseudouridine1911/1915/1917 synthase